MPAIDVGPGYGARPNQWWGGQTVVSWDNPADGDGVLDTIYVTAQYSAAQGVKVGTFHGSGAVWAPRDYETIGTVATGNQTFTGLSCDVVTGDVLGEYHSSGCIVWSNSGAGGLNYDSGDFFGGSHSYVSADYDGAESIYATGATGGGGWANLAKCKGIASADMAKRKGIAVADIAKVKGAAV